MNDSKGLVSIAMATYNGERYLKEQLNSIVNQSYKNLEIIICDDCSTDNTIKIIQDFLKKDSRIQFYHNKNNLGYSKNFEYAISLCTGDYIALSDQDDIWKLNKIEIMMSNIGASNLIYGDEDLIDEYGNLIGTSFFKTTEHSTNHNTFKTFYAVSHIYGHNMMFHKKIKNAIIPIPIKFYDIWIAIIASKNGRIKYIDKVLCSYRQHTGSISNIIRRKRTIFQKIFSPIDWKTYKLWNMDRINRLKIFKKLFPEDEIYLKNLINYYSHQNRLNAFLFATKNINYIVNKKGILRKIKYILLPLFAPKVEID